MNWYVYILRCADGTLYTGSTNDPVKRLAMHSAGKGAKYTKGRGPVEQVYLEQLQTKQEALRREYAIKQLTRSQKLELIQGKSERTGAAPLC